MPPRATFSPLECSEGTNPIHDEQVRALSKRENAPVSTTNESAVMASIPFTIPELDALRFRRWLDCVLKPATIR